MLVNQPEVVLELIGTTIGGTMFSATDELHLYVNELVIGPETVVGDFTEATLTNYAAVVLAEDWLTGIDPDTGSAIIKYPLNILYEDLVQNTGPETIYGWYVTDTAGTVLKAAGTLDESVPVTTAEITFGLLVWLLIAATSNGHEEVIE